MCCTVQRRSNKYKYQVQQTGSEENAEPQRGSAEAVDKHARESRQCSSRRKQMPHCQEQAKYVTGAEVWVWGI